MNAVLTVPLYDQSDLYWEQKDGGSSLSYFVEYLNGLLAQNFLDNQKQIGIVKCALDVGTKQLSPKQFGVLMHIAKAYGNAHYASCDEYHDWNEIVNILVDGQCSDCENRQRRESDK